MSSVATRDGVETCHKDWGEGQPVVFNRGWPLSAEDWDARMMSLLRGGYRAIAHDRRGHGRSTQAGDGHDVDHHADDLAAGTEHPDLGSAIHVGHSTGGGVVRYLARHDGRRAAKVAIINAVPPLMARTAADPGGLPKDVSDGFQARLAGNRLEFRRANAAGPFYNHDRPAANAWEAIIQDWRRHDMMGDAKAHHDGIVAFFRSDFTADLEKIDASVLAMHSEDDRIGPYADAGQLSFQWRLEDLHGYSARHANDLGRGDQRRSPCLLQELNGCMARTGGKDS